MSQILITGARGFIGRNIAEYLSNWYSVFTPTSNQLDLRDLFSVQKYFDEHHFDYVIHCANRGGVRGVADDSLVFQDNMNMLKNLLISKEAQTKLITFGSGAQYDKSRSLHKVTEDEIGKHIPHDSYGLSKLEMIKIINGRDDVLCLIIFGCYGRYEKETRFPTYAILNNLASKPIVIENNSKFDYLYIDDLARIIDQFIQHFPMVKVINVTPTESITMSEIANIVNKIGKNAVDVIINNSGIEYTGDNTKLLTELGDFVFTTYTDGLKYLYSINGLDTFKI